MGCVVSTSAASKNRNVNNRYAVDNSLRRNAFYDLNVNYKRRRPVEEKHGNARGGESDENIHWNRFSDGVRQLSAFGMKEDGRGRMKEMGGPQYCRPSYRSLSPRIVINYGDDNEQNDEDGDADDDPRRSTLPSMRDLLEHRRRLIERLVNHSEEIHQDADEMRRSIVELVDKKARYSVTPRHRSAKSNKTSHWSKKQTVASDWSKNGKPTVHWN